MDKTFILKKSNGKIYKTSDIAKMREQAYKYAKTRTRPFSILIKFKDENIKGGTFAYIEPKKDKIYYTDAVAEYIMYKGGVLKKIKY